MRWGPTVALALLVAACAPMEQRFAEACRGRGPEGGTAEMARCVEERRVAQREHTAQAVRALLSAPEHRMAVAGRG